MMDYQERARTKVGGKLDLDWFQGAYQRQVPSQKPRVEGRYELGANKAHRLPQGLCA